jgi:serine/threonine protein kinase
MKDKKAYLVDFGLAKILKGEPYSYTFCGSYSYLAPEMINKKGHDESLDWYLLGVLTYQLLHGITPYYDNDLNKFFKKVVEGNLKISELVSTEGRKFICSLMKMDSF